MSHFTVGLSSDGLSSFTLRARLSSQGPPTSGPAAPSPPSPDDQLKLDDLYRHFRDHFVPANSVAGNEDSGENNGGHGNANLMVQLGESFAQAGLKLHTSVVHQLSQSQVEIDANISTFSKFSSSILSDLDGLYSNIAYPLSATLCHSANFPRATIGAHLVSVQEKLKLAEGELRGLHEEWEENLRSEYDLRQELGTEVTEQGSNNTAWLYSGQAEAFKQEVEQIVRDQIRALDDIEAHYKESVQAETMEMMQFILAD
ncbi:hypothetical protein PT974_05510 [Cladobotryum mycophilum]|uniref:Biogenesis of lysosome-related organelles complex 1 subunit 5 n=1 Tax=Cladobotryum mycophilum TaxID=491253 RepID=A0ABR0SIW6_9HYPO